MPGRDPLRVAVAQLQVIPGNVEANVTRVVSAIHASADSDARLVLFSENYLTGYEPDLIRIPDSPNRLTLDDPRLSRIADACATRNVYAVVGTPILIEKSVFNAAVVFNNNGNIIAWYGKHQLYRGERDLFTRGLGPVSIMVDGWRCGLAICYDSGFPEHSRSYALDGCDLYLVSALFSKEVGENELRVWMPARSLDNTMYVAMANFCGRTGGWETCGYSGIWGPLGQVLAQAGPADEQIVFAVLSDDRIAHARKLEPMLQDWTIQR